MYVVCIIKLLETAKRFLLAVEPHRSPTGQEGAFSCFVYSSTLYCHPHQVQFQSFFWLSGGIESNLSLVLGTSLFLVYENAKIRIGIKNRNSTQISSTNCFYLSSVYMFKKLDFLKFCFVTYVFPDCYAIMQFKNTLADLHPQKWLVRRLQSISLQIKVRVC